LRRPASADFLLASMKGGTGGDRRNEICENRPVLPVDRSNLKKAPVGKPAGAFYMW